jgi:glutamyl-tRNA synthetase
MRYPGTCRPVSPTARTYEPDTEESLAWRLRAPDEPIHFEDEFAGPQSVNVQRQAGDFIVATKAGLPAYQLAVVVDDHAQGVPRVVRGDDLIHSTPRQLLVYRALRLEPEPRYIHVPLVRGEDGRRLAKRHGDTRLIRYQQRGVPAERIIGLLGEWSGLGPRQPMTAAEFAEGFDLNILPPDPVTFTAEDDRWLSEGSDR